MLWGGVRRAAYSSPAMRCGERWATTLKDSNLTVSATGWLSLVLKVLLRARASSCTAGRHSSRGVGTGEGDGDCPESVVARQAVRKIAGGGRILRHLGQDQRGHRRSGRQGQLGNPFSGSAGGGGGATGRGGRHRGACEGGGDG